MCHSLQASLELPVSGSCHFKAGFKGGRIFRGVLNILASFYWGIKYFGKNCEVSDGL